MTADLKLSKKLHLAAIFCFLLPFFYTGCEQTREVDNKNIDVVQDVEMIDTIVIETLSDDTISSQNIFNENDSTVRDSVTDNKTPTIIDLVTDKDDDDNLTDLIINKLPFLRYVLNPSISTYSGFGIIINSLIYISYYSTLISFLLLILCLIFKSIEKYSYKSFVILDILALFFLTIPIYFPLSYFTLWGFWVSTFLMFLLTIYDIFLLRASRNI